MPPKGGGHYSNRGGRGNHGNGDFGHGNGGNPGGRRNHGNRRGGHSGDGHRQKKERPKETPEQAEAKAFYHSWKRLIKFHPGPADLDALKDTWTSALEILNGDDLDCKHWLPRDLESDDYKGRQHIQAVMGAQAHPGNSQRFLDLAKSFLLVFTHDALLNCLALETAVNSLYNFFSGSNGSKAVEFLQKVCDQLPKNNGNMSATSSASLEESLLAISKALHECLKREPRSQFHDNLPKLFNSIERIIGDTGLAKQSAVFQYIIQVLRECRIIVGLAQNLLYKPEELDVPDSTPKAVVSTYPRPLILPRDRHDNDKLDIGEIQILPTMDELRSNAPEFLPSTDLNQTHFLSDPALRHIDTAFRLLRHDIFGEMKDALGGKIIAMEKNPRLLSMSNFDFGSIRAHSYPNARIQDAKLSERHRVDFVIAFPQPHNIQRASPAVRRRWWEESKRLEPDSFLCLLSLDKSQSAMLFLTVTKKIVDGKDVHNLTADNMTGYIAASLATKTQGDFALASRLLSRGSPCVLVELPGVILGTFMPILESLQNMYKNGRLPFGQYLLPDRSASTETIDVQPPSYARTANFKYSLKSILVDPTGPDILLDPRASTTDKALVEKLEAATTLDRGQCIALIAALVRELAQIQGPPGTGKSYLGVNIMKVLLACAKQAKLGPIIVVCYTNHALDQFLEHIMDDTEEIIRVGGQSKSARLAGKNLRIVSKDHGKSKSEAYACAQAFREIEDMEERTSKYLESFHRNRRQGPQWSTLNAYLKKKLPAIHSQFSRFDNEGFQTAGRLEPFDAWLRAQTPGTKGAKQNVKQLLDLARENVHDLCQADRRRLAELWLSNVQDEIADGLYESVKEIEVEQQELRNIYSEVDRRVLEEAKVIGATTSGLAKNMTLFQHIKSKVLIVEEAGEIMEPHFLTALLPSIQHVISIGDHQQLRPQINNHRLSLESREGAAYKLDVSQFERLSIGEPGCPRFPVAQLNIQRRMRPQISELIRATLYPRLIDHENTKILPDVVGLKKNVFWLDHENCEASKEDHYQKSHSNAFEVDLTHALLRHVVRQGTYRPADIAVITPYVGQLQKLRKKFQTDFEIVLNDRDEEQLVKEGFVEIGKEEDVNPSKSYRRPLAKKPMSELLRLATVDNFQGEEAKVVIVSLVRSNKEKKVGFLKTTNRINVLLSRAQHGLYLIGSANTYANVPMWNDVLGMLRAQDCVGPAFDLCCPRHPDTLIQASTPEEFAAKSPEGGCKLTCDRRLNSCGHKCLAPCHADTMHEVFACPRPCERLHSPCSHSCQKTTCGEDCGRCMIKIDNVMLPCGHIKDRVDCWQTQKEHLPTVQCNVLVEKLIPGCNHRVQIPCHRDISAASFKCPQPCDHALDCQHNCPGFCGRCRRTNVLGEVSVTHSPCKKICDRPYGTCNHRCRSSCHEGKPCLPCAVACEVRCPHSKCSLSCAEPCAPCIEKCTWNCEHQGKCSMPCSAPCDRLPCDIRCERRLGCGHQCPSLCGEVCPDNYCQDCKQKLDSRVDLLEMKAYEEIDLNETPIVVLGCGHFFTAETLDGMVSMSTVYKIDGYGKYIGLENLDNELSTSIPCCPDCKTPIRQFITPRYNRVINRAVMDEMSKRFLVSGLQELEEYDKRIMALEKDLELSRLNVKGICQELGAANQTAPLRPASHGRLSKISDIVRHTYVAASKLGCDISIFKALVGLKNQPAQKLHEAIIVGKRAQTLEQQMSNLGITQNDPMPLDQRVTLGAQAADFKAVFIVFNHRFSITQLLKSSPTTSTVTISGGLPEQQCGDIFKKKLEFIQECKSNHAPQLAVEVTLYFARLAHQFQIYSHKLQLDLKKPQELIVVAKTLLEEAKTLCETPFQNAGVLKKAVEDVERLLGKEWYAEVTKEELEAIKKAMVNGRGGIATHSGHWYRCSNGHPFAIGECGMPMELARCDCGAQIGGQNHTAVAGITRATEMED